MKIHWSFVEESRSFFNGVPCFGQGGDKGVKIIGEISGISEFEFIEFPVKFVSNKANNAGKRGAYEPDGEIDSKTRKNAMSRIRRKLIRRIGA